MTRTHPVEGLVFTARSVLVQGVTIASFVFLFGNQVDMLTIFGVNIFIVTFHGLGSNPRHSHISIRYPQAIEWLLMSPAQHQLHHSQSEQHYDRNFGVALSVWDRMFGSFHHSVSETLSFGIGNKTARFTGSIWSMYWLLSEASHGASPAPVLPLTGRLPAQSHASVRGITDHGTA